MYKSPQNMYYFDFTRASTKKRNMKYNKKKREKNSTFYEFKIIRTIKNLKKNERLK